MANISAIKLPDDTSYNIKAVAIPFGKLDSTSTSTAMTASVSGITELVSGVCVWLTNGVVTSAANFTIDINGLGGKPVYSSQSAASRATTIFNVNYTALLIYNETRVSGGCWDYVYGYDSNTNTIGYQVRTNSLSLPMKSIVYRYRLLFTSADGKGFVPANNSTSTNATTARSITQEKIDPFGRIVYYGTTASVAAGSRPSASYLWQQYAFNIGYSFVVTLTEWKPVYVKCAPQSDGSAIIDSTTPFVQTLPSAEDGKIYIFLGVAYSSTNIELTLEHPVYYYSNGCIRQWTNSNKTEQTYNGNSSMSQTSYTNSIVNGNTAEFSCTSGSNKAFIQAGYDDSGEGPVIILGGYTSTNGYKNSLFVDPSGEITIHNLSAPVQNTDAATKGYVDTAIGAISAPVPATANPLMDGTAAVGTSTKYAREDHVHPKATYTASEVGLGNVDNVQQYSASNPPPYPVTSVNGETGAVNLSIPTKTSDLTNDSGFITGMYIASYGSSTYAQILAAYQANKVVYCRASSNSNPGTGSQNRMAFLAYVNNSTTPTEFEFQYYRSVSTHSDSQQGDQVFVYKLNSSTGWSVTTREAYTKITTGTGLSKSYNNGTLTLSYSGATPPSAATADPLMDGTAAVGSSAKYAKEDHVHPSDTSKVDTSFTDESSYGHVEFTNTITNGYRAKISSSSGTNEAYVLATFDDSAELPIIVLGGKQGYTDTDSIYVLPDGVEIHNLAAPINNNDAATKAYVDSAVSGVGGDVVYAHFTESNGTVTCDHTVSEINDAITAGKDVIGVYLNALSGVKKSSTWGTHYDLVFSFETYNSIANISRLETYVIYMSDEGSITKSYYYAAMPTVTSADNGKVLMVVNGAWAAASLPVYNGGVS